MGARTINKHYSGLKVKCFEMPNALYTRPLGASVGATQQTYKHDEY